MANQDAARTALIAAADQGIAQNTKCLKEMIADYRVARGSGTDRVVATGAATIANLTSLSRVHLAQLLAVAVDMLAEQEPRS